MAVQGWMFSNKENNADDEATRLLSYRTLGTRMSQVDDILKRKTEAALFALDEEETGKQESNEELDATKDLQRKEKIVKELLKKVKKRRKLVRSYSYFSWFCAFFACFLGNLYIKAQLNEHLFSVDESIKNRIVDILPIGNIGSNAQFYDWMLQVVVDVFEDSVCGNGVCEPPLEYPGMGRFGCAVDCGLYPQRTSLRIDVQTAWTAGIPGLDFAGFNMTTAGDPPVKFTYNIYSETMGAYLLATDATQVSVTVDVPDGNLRLELYQVGLVSPDTPGRYLSTYGGIAPSTMVAARKRFDYQYGDAAEAIATAAAVNRKLHSYCTSDPNNASAQCKGAYSPEVTGVLLRNMYGLTGNVSMIGNGKDRQNLVTFPFCALSPPSSAADAQLDTSFCNAAGSSSTSKCYNASILAQRFVCPGSYSFSLWAFGPPRNVTVKPLRTPPIRTLTPYNNVIGGIIVTQYIRKTVQCPYQNSESISTLTGRFSCQAADLAEVPFGIDPVFLPSSQLYNGKLTARDFYTNQEMFKGTDDPLSFYPHQWDNGNQKAEVFISPESVGLYKLFFDSRLSAAKARQLVQFMKDGMFLNNKTDWIEMEIITYNADFNLFGILTVQFRWNLGGSTLWNYQYNTALLSPYEGTKGLISISFDIIFGAMLFADIIRECRDIYNCYLRENLINGYIMKFWNWVEWTHFGLLLSGFFFWISYNQYIAAIGFKSDYPVLRDLDAPARFFATDPLNEFDLLDFTIKMRKLSDLKNFWTALSCVNILLFVMRFLKVLDFQPRMSLITRTLQLASVDLGHYLTLFSIILIGYATIGTVLLGERLKQFQTFGDACAALFMILMAWEPQTMYTSMSTATNQAKIGATIISFQIFFWSWVLIATFIMLNIVLAIIVEAFSHIKASLKEAPTITAESLSVWRQTMRMLSNRLLGREWLISDKELEKVLIAHDRSFQSRKNFLKSVGQIRGTIKSRCVRIPGGLQVSDRDLEKLLQGHACTGRKSVLSKAKNFLRQNRNPRPRSASQSSRRFSMTSFTNSKEDGIDIAEDHGYCPPIPVADLMNRYGEVVVDGQDDEEMLRLLQTENIKREMALYATQDKIREHVETVVETLDSMIDFVLPTDEIKKLREARLEARNQEAKLGSKNLRGKANYIFDGILRVVVVAAKRLPKLDLFSESDPYCVLILEEKTAHKGSSQTVLAATDTRMNDPNPIWNSEHEFPLQCTDETSLVAAMLDRDEVGSDEMIGMIRISMSDLPVDEEVDRWYRLRNDASPNLTKRALVRLKICLIPTKADSDEVNTPAKRQKANDPTLSRPRRSSEIEGELLWLKERLSTAADGCQPKCRGILEVTVVSAQNLPKRGKIFTKLSLCDPYMKVAYNDIEFVSIVRKNTYCPEWGQSFAFDLEDISSVGPLRVTVMDWNKYSQHELIGVVEITEDQIHHILFETYTDWNQQHTFPILKNELPVVGFDGKIAQVALSFRCTARRIGGVQGSFDAIDVVASDPEPVITCDLLGCNGDLNGDGAGSSRRSSNADSRHGDDAFRNPSGNGADIDKEMKVFDDVRATRKSEPRNGCSLADRYRMASRLVSNLGAARPQDFRESIAIVESPRCLKATLHQGPSNVQVSLPEWSDCDGSAAVRRRRRQGPRKNTPASRRAAALEKDVEGDDTASDSW